ncbi:membrane protein [Catenovulum agarivorans DS-2]|uniref:Membrane protein n=1 Tax=Catenovulum agarivorans DS-2 TaxID=1328313 RepID=W7QPD3_9ALTE|nr:DMT family transporter [Catenovulum agarivorans]EWH09743.1 membrane protein [Catenovulum agarivorans DS-2]
MPSKNLAAVERSSALLQVHLGVLLLGGTALFSKIIPLDGAAISFVRACVAAVVLTILVKAREGRIRLNSLRDYRNGMILGVLMSVHWVTYFYAMQLSTVATGMIALYTYPVMIVLIEPLLHKQFPNKMDFLMALVVLTGVGLMVPELSLESEYTLGILLGVLSAVFFAARNIMSHKVFSHYSGMKNMMFQSSIIACVLLPFEYQDLAGISLSTLLWILLLGVIFTALPHSLIVNGLRYLKAKTMSLVSCLSPFYGTIFAAVLLAEYPNWQTLVGGLLVVSAAVYETLTGHKRG